MARMRSWLLMLCVIIATVAVLDAVASPSLEIQILGDLSPAQLDLLSDLFEIMLAAGRAAEYRDLIDREIGRIEGEISLLDRTLEEAEEKYSEARSRTITSLRWLHRMGPASYLEVLLASSSLGDLVRRLEIVTAAARGSLMALEDVRDERDALAGVRGERDVLETHLEDLVSEREALDLKEVELARQEDRAAGVLGARWPAARSDLEGVMRLWQDEALPHLQWLPTAFSRLATTGLDPAEVTVIPSFFSVRVIIPESSLNQLMAREPGLGGTRFRFTPGEAQLTVPGLHLVVRGSISMDRSGLLTYQVSGVEMAGLTVRDPDLHLDRIQLDMGSLLAGMNPRSITVTQGAVEVVLSLFP